MSKWTNIVGSISADCLASCLGIESTPEELAKKITGRWENVLLKTDQSDITFYDPLSLEAKIDYGSGVDMPSGSEFPLFYVVQRIGTTYSANNLLITFWGNLRDYDDEHISKELIPYFKELLIRYKGAGIRVRNMAINIRCQKEYFLTEKKGQLAITV